MAQTKPRPRRVRSTNLKSVAYNRTSRRLVVRFQSKAIYAYRSVPQSKVTGLLNAPSKGRYLLRNIVPFYDATRLRKWSKKK